MDDDQRSVSYVPSIGDEEEWVDFQDVEQTVDLFGGDMFEHHDGETFEHSLDFGISSFEPGRASELQPESTMPVGVELPVASLEPAPLTGNSWNTMLAHAFASNMNVAATCHCHGRLGQCVTFSATVFCQLLHPPFLIPPTCLSLTLQDSVALRCPVCRQQ